MAKKPPEGSKQLAPPFATGGGGDNFQFQVQACFVALMLSGGYAPCLACRPIQKIKLQGRHADFETDDMIVFTANDDGTEEKRLICQIKHRIQLTEGDPTFRDVIRAAWKDFNNARVFTKGKDAIALITGPLSETDIHDVRAILEWAKSQEPHEFITNVARARFSSGPKLAKFQAFRAHIETANGGPVSDDDIVAFLHHFHLLGYDLDVRSGMMHALLHSVIGARTSEGPAGVWGQILHEVMHHNQNAGTITRSSFPDITSMFSTPPVATMPAEIARTVAPQVAGAWTDPKFAFALMILSLVGCWNEKSEGDREVMEYLTGGHHDEVLNLLREVVQFSDNPVTYRNGLWSIKDKWKLWHHVGSRIFDEHLERFRHAARIALSESDPKFDIDKDQRFAAAMYGKTLKHSECLRKGIAETLALMGSRPEPLTNCSIDAPTTTALLVVRGLLADVDWVRWASLNSVLPLLAEASPTEFLRAVEDALIAAPCPFDELFAQEGGPLGGSNYITGLLWALEGLAWDNEQLIPVTVALGRLAERDPGGQWSNRPKNSLTTIFLPWLPQTTASIEKRTIAVRTLLREAPAAGWELLLSLLPSSHGMSSHTHRPQWRRSIPENWPERPTRKEYVEQVLSYSDLAVDIAIAELPKLLKLTRRLDQLPKQSFERVLEHISSEQIKELPEEERYPLWEALAGVARKHRRYADAEWAMPDEVVTVIEAAASGIAPADPKYRHRYLFSERDLDLFEEKGNWQEQQQALEARRVEAAREILDVHGIDGVIEFARLVESSWNVGYSSGSIDNAGLDARVFPSLLASEEANLQQFAGGYVLGRLRQHDWNWFDGLISDSWSKADMARLLVALPFSSETWERAGRWLRDDMGLYWTQAKVNPYQAEGDIHIAIDNLLKHGRPHAAIDCLAKRAYDDVSVDSTRAVRALLAALESSEPTFSMDQYHIIKLIQALQKDESVDRSEIMKVEWAYLPLLDEYHDATPKTLEYCLATDPAVFCEVIRFLYRSSNEGEPAREPTEANKARAHGAFQLLHVWKTPPGTTVEGGYSSTVLHQWLEAVTRSATESGHLDLALQHAGGVLIHAPADPDGLWMHRAVAEALNREDMEQLRRGYELAVYNSRGVHFVDPSGEPERELARLHKRHADEVENQGYHRVAMMLRRVADDYDQEAERVVAEHKAETESGETTDDVPSDDPEKRANDEVDPSD